MTYKASRVVNLTAIRVALQVADIQSNSPRMQINFTAATGCGTPFAALTESIRAATLAVNTGSFSKQFTQARKTLHTFRVT